MSQKTKKPLEQLSKQRPSPCQLRWANVGQRVPSLAKTELKYMFTPSGHIRKREEILFCNGCKSYAMKEKRMLYAVQAPRKVDLHVMIQQQQDGTL